MFLTFLAKRIHQSHIRSCGNRTELQTSRVRPDDLSAVLVKTLRGK